MNVLPTKEMLTDLKKYPLRKGTDELRPPTLLRRSPAPLKEPNGVEVSEKPPNGEKKKLILKQGGSSRRTGPDPDPGFLGPKETFLEQLQKRRALSMKCARETMPISQQTPSKAVLAPQAQELATVPEATANPDAPCRRNKLVSGKRNVLRKPRMSVGPTIQKCFKNLRQAPAVIDCCDTKYAPWLFESLKVSWTAF